MTRKEALNRWVLPTLREVWNEKKCEEIMKALEQEPVLDKIRAEITNIPITDSDGHFNNWYREPQAIINDVLRIIDKHKAESEEV